ncbi:hypothetical protein P22_3460 [Propionispora sp. 2/2-37]|uniref:DeoR/GlpR family DNA-binding transcription regulator n=1 Tax=Propionispora sp. 2/2-37 TaxID=1677858 RepID=UPI0006BB8903|nr:DeoR/GlpR family DNA-binding transcription regulator [Propionispora sp. 2/2-37]CUH97333.1 hypothetical protein P22_3460 [Propionispora sp. 2/2-37]
MFVEERKKRILDILQDQHRVTVNQLTESLPVSEATIRRDLQDLEQQGSLKRTRGGAILSHSSNFEPPFPQKEALASEEKKYIGKLAASFLNDGDTVIIDSGTTTLQTIAHLNQKDLTVITNSVCAITALSQKPDIRFIVAGGYNRCQSQALVGDWTLTMLKQFHANKLFLGVDGIDLIYGFTTPSIEEVAIKQQMIKCADEVFVIADSNKFNRVTLNKVAEIEEVDYIITDPQLSPVLAEKYTNRGVTIITKNEAAANSL